MKKPLMLRSLAILLLGISIQAYKGLYRGVHVVDDTVGSALASSTLIGSALFISVALSCVLGLLLHSPYIRADCNSGEGTIIETLSIGLICLLCTLPPAFIVTALLVNS